MSDNNSAAAEKKTGGSFVDAVIIFCVIVLAAAGACIGIRLANGDYTTGKVSGNPGAVKAASTAAAPVVTEEAPQPVTTDGTLSPALLAAHPELNTSVTYRLPGGVQTLDGNTMISWLVPNGDGTYTKDEATWNQHLSDYVSTMAASVDTLGKDRTFHATGIGDVSMNTGSYYGWVIDQNNEIARLNADIEAQNTIVREPVYSSREITTDADNNGIGQNYAEIDLSRQHLWIYKDGALVFETDIVSGSMDEAHYTPEGIYLLLNKEKDAVLKGDQLPDGSRTYEQPVSYWMPITHSGIGLHDASWKSVFGGLEYINNGSHGCINLPPDVAPSVYELISMSMPIVIYYSQPYELREAPESALELYYKRKADAEQAAGTDTSSEAFADADGDGIPDNLTYTTDTSSSDAPSGTAVTTESSPDADGTPSITQTAEKKDPRQLYPLCDNGLCDTDGNGVGDTDPSLLGY